MPTSTGPWICIDASIVLPLVTRGTSGAPFQAAWRRWLGDGRRPIAPSLLMYEVAEVLQRYVQHRMLLPEEAADALEAVLGLGIEIRGDPELHRRAMAIARSFGLLTAHDAHYLALAERVDAEFWTADQRLIDSGGNRLPWVKVLRI